MDLSVDKKTSTTNSNRKMRKRPLDAHGAFIARLRQSDALRLQIAHRYTKVRPHVGLDDTDDLAVYLPRGVDVALQSREKIFRVAQRRDLDDLHALSDFERLGDKAGVFETFELRAPVVEGFVEVVQVFVQKTARRGLQREDTQ